MLNSPKSSGSTKAHEERSNQERKIKNTKKIR